MNEPGASRQRRLRRQRWAGSWAVVQTGGNGILFAGVPLLLLCYVFVPLAIIQFIALFLLVLLLGSRIYSEYLIRGLSLTRRDAGLRCFRNEWFEVEIAVENRGRFPAFMLAAGDTPGRIAVFRNIKRLYALGGRRRVIFRWQGYGSSRGEFELGPAVLRGADPLGFFPFTLVAADTARLFVYPAPGFVNLKPPGGIPLGALITANPFNEDLTRSRSLREYYPGDEMRRINWKATARLAGSAQGSPLMVNEYEQTLSYPLVVFLNADPVEYALKTREFYLERAIEAATALCLMASRDRQALGFILHTKAGRFGENVVSPSAFTLVPVLERLAVFQRRDLAEGEGGGGVGGGATRTGGLTGSAARMLDEGKFLPFGTRLVYAGPRLNDEDYRALESLRRYHLTLEYLIIDEHAVEYAARETGGLLSRRYQIKERGYEIL
jgi:uncharacterized protein (DUF58 family)